MKPGFACVSPRNVCPSALDEALARFRGRTQPTINILLQALNM